MVVTLWGSVWFSLLEVLFCLPFLWPLLLRQQLTQSLCLDAPVPSFSRIADAMFHKQRQGPSRVLMLSSTGTLASPKLAALSMYHKHGKCPILVWQSLSFHMLKLQHAGISMQVLSAYAVERETKHSTQVVQVTVKTVTSIDLTGMLRTHCSGETTLAVH
jgi:hypothetical protein